MSILLIASIPSFFLKVKVDVFLHFINIIEFFRMASSLTLDIINTFLLYIIYLIFCPILTLNPYAFAAL
ncbi:hypothetical protein F2N11_07750 [Campylobacter upsaliensis]|uniref:Uncharacterized protein n=1 Tax=Campylobacter upsaliensis TaxID=28080 RepID=A0A5M1DVR0_CAMUP|nr:hypothetical protein [Campylobacter upsaliensis]EAJ5079926.1 hypothetical protein [Campylobacter upsaliensis]EBD1833832.1 hypothetical protein [Campylobacter upsaliensis]ECV9714025.1 hypothetical protein [Campylobacter upsaliensis]